MNDFQEVSVAILAGGEGRRMGGLDKGLIPYKGRPLIEYVIQSLPENIAGLVISANRNLESYRRYGPVIADQGPGHAGPLAGILAVLQHVKTPYLLVLPCDTPHLPEDLLPRLYAALQENDAEIAVARSGKHRHHVIALLKTSLQQDLEAFLAAGERRVGLWQQRHTRVDVLFDDEENFRNINSSDALK
jgi:molybdopterin-guanine dinucleotide biosynthesis protein A